MRRPIEIRIHDASLGIWQDDPNDSSFRSDVYGELIRRMRERGWSIKSDPQIRRRHRSLNDSRRLGALGSLRCSVEICGRAIELEFWSATSKQSNPNGRRYDFDKMKRMSHLDRLRVELEFRRITAWLETIAPTKVSRSVGRDLPPMEHIRKSYADSWHADKALGRPLCRHDYNRKSKDGALFEHEQTVWLADQKGRILRGTAYYHINNMWFVVAGGRLFNEGCHALYAVQPADLRRKRNERLRRSKLEAHLAAAVGRMDFQRAQLLKGIIFGSEPTFMIWARDHSAFYRAQYAGYTTDRIAAGKYTRDEAERECRRVPHELEMVCPDGRHVSFDARAA